jgi:hypothetical protein
MLMADTMAIFLVILGLMLALPGLWLLCRALWPDTVAIASERYGRGLWAPFLVGLPITAMTIAVVAIFLNLFGALGKMTGVVLLSLFLFYSHAGTAGLATLIGQSLPSPVDDTRPWRATLRGGLILELTYLLPLLGWFVILPVSTVMGCGGATLAILSRIKNRLRVSSSLPSVSVDGLRNAAAVNSATTGVR